MSRIYHDGMSIGEDEIIDGDGLEVIEGDELEEEIFGEDNRQAKMARLNRLAIARQAGRVVVRKKSRNEQAMQPLPIPPVTVAAGAQQVITLAPQRLFRVERLVVWSGLASEFNINSLNVGQDNQFVAQGAMPAGIFTEVAVGVRLRGSTANLGNTITLVVTNTDTVNPRTFGGAIVGTAVY